MLNLTVGIIFKYYLYRLSIRVPYIYLSGQDNDETV